MEPKEPTPEEISSAKQRAELAAAKAERERIKAVQQARWDAEAKAAEAAALNG